PSPLASAGDFHCIGIEQTLLEIGHAWFERFQPFVNVEKYFVGETAWDESLPKLSLRVVVRIEFVRVARPRRLQHALVVRVVAEANRIVLYTCRTGSRDDRLQRPNLARLEGPGNATGERQLVQRVNPVRRVIEFPIRMTVALLQRIPRAHAELDRDDVGLPI